MLQPGLMTMGRDGRVGGWRSPSHAAMATARTKSSWGPSRQLASGSLASGGFFIWKFNRVRLIPSGQHDGTNAGAEPQPSDQLQDRLAHSGQVHYQRPVHERLVGEEFLQEGTDLSEGRSGRHPLQMSDGIATDAATPHPKIFYFRVRDLGPLQDGQGGEVLGLSEIQSNQMLVTH